MMIQAEGRCLTHWATQSKDFKKLKVLMFIQPKEAKKNLRETQLYLKKNRSFRSLQNEVQLQLCQTTFYQEFEVESMVLR
ncbi:neuromedin-U-25 [Canis lupus familiaris]|uniref:neuromedin-U-25 n=1 Tax=Canis lupus familiaris TaxID=9615 RepID=UPI00005A2AC0|nr:neuromedin-U-25 [Canis lupus familiaris]